MAYEKVKLVVAGMSGEIYMARINNDSTMSDSRRIATEDCLRATTEWFLKNQKKMIQYSAITGDKKPTLFYTDNPAKADRIREILEEE